MRKLFRVLMAAGMIAAMLWPMQATAALHSQCGGYYTRSAGCMFSPMGPNLFISGSGVGSVVVRVSDPTGRVQLLSCYGATDCMASYGPGSTGTDSIGPPAGVGPLLCTVVSGGAGYYSCQSNT